MNPRSPWAALLLAAVVAAVVVGVDRVAPDSETGPDPIAEPTATTPAAGSWVCSVGDGRDDTSLETLVARPTGLGAGPASVQVETLREGDLSPISLPPLFPPSHLRESLEPGGDDTATWVRWEGAPVTVTREWRWSGEGDLPAATVTGPCAQAFSSQWVIPGMSTVGGNEARLRLANPFRTDATIAIHFVTPEGIREPIALQNWTVPAQTVREININEVMPELDDLAAVVEVATGRLSVEGYQIARAAIGGIDGGSLLAAAPAPSETWTVPWIADGDGASSWLWIVNTGDRTAPIELTLHTPDGGDVPDGLAELTVAPGELRRVDLGGTLPDGADGAAVTVRSDGAPVVVSAATRQASPDVDDPDELDPADPDEEEADEDVPDDEAPDDEAPDDEEEPDPDVDETAPTASDTGFVVQLGATAGDRNWVISGGATADREEQLRLANPSGDPATVDIVIFDGATVLEPSELQDVEVPAGSASSLDLTEHLGNVDSWSAFVTASDGQVIAGRVGSGGADALHLVAVPGTPGAATLPAGPLLAGTESAGFVHRMGTSLGLQDVDPFDVPVPDPVDPPADPTFDDVLEPDGIEEEGPSLDDPDDDPDDPGDGSGDGTGPDGDVPDPDVEVADPDLGEAPAPDEGA